MKISYLPFVGIGREFGPDPIKLPLVHIRAVQRIERHAVLLELVILLPFHVEELVVFLIRVVMVAQSGVELNALVYQRLICLFEFGLHIGRLVGPVDVVADGDRRIEP